MTPGQKVVKDAERELIALGWTRNDNGVLEIVLSGLGGKPDRYPYYPLVEWDFSDTPGSREVARLKTNLRKSGGVPQPTGFHGCSCCSHSMRICKCSIPAAKWPSVRAQLTKKYPNSNFVFIPKEGVKK